MKRIFSFLSLFIFFVCNSYCNISDALQSLSFLDPTYVLARGPLPNRWDVLRYAYSQINLDGFYLEMGVWTGESINPISTWNRSKTIYGFDSFQGLPEDWIAGHPKGIFALEDGRLPPVHSNVCLVSGWYEDSLPKFKNELLKDNPIAFLHIDCDVYSSTKTVFDILGGNIADGTIIVFDEFYNYPGFENHECKAFLEFIKQRNLTAEYIAYSIDKQVAVRIHTEKEW